MFKLYVETSAWRFMLRFTSSDERREARESIETRVTDPGAAKWLVMRDNFGSDVTIRKRDIQAIWTENE